MRDRLFDDDEIKSHAECGGEIAAPEQPGDTFRCLECGETGTDFTYDDDQKVILLESEEPLVARADAY
jgi:hypothetical protein